MSEPIVVGRPPTKLYERPLVKAVLGMLPFGAIAGAWLYYSHHQPRYMRYAIPKLDATMHSIWRDVVVTGAVWPNAKVTAEEAGIGLGIAIGAALLVGPIIGLSRTAEKMMYPSIITVKSLPAIALAPLLSLIFGFGIESKIALVVLVVFLPVLVKVIEGMRAIRLDELDLLHSLDASWLQVMFKVRVQRAIPHFFAGVQVAVVFSLLAAVAAEFVGGQAGLGWMINFRSNSLDPAGAFSAIIVLTTISVSLNLILRSSERLIAGWTES